MADIISALFLFMLVCVVSISAVYFLAEIRGFRRDFRAANKTVRFQPLKPLFFEDEKNIE